MTTSSPLPSSLVCEVGSRIDEGERDRLRSALLSLNDSESGREVLASLRLDRFEDVSVDELHELESAFGAKTE